jgi:hypothetical protein
MDQFTGASEAALGNRRYALVALVGLAGVMVFMSATSKDIAKGLRSISLVYNPIIGALTLTAFLPECAAGRSIRETADAVESSVKATKDEVAGTVKKKH